MGTRGLTKVISNGETVIAQYGQWDHYPAGQGITALAFLSNSENIDKLKAGLSKVYYPTESELETLIKSFSHRDGWMNMEDGDRFSKAFPSLTRDTGAGILEVVANATAPVPISKDEEFENDDLFCEGVYTVDLDTNTFTSKYDKTISFSIDNLPTPEEYLQAFANKDEEVFQSDELTV